MSVVLASMPRLLGDRMFIRPLPWKPSATIDVIRFGRPVRGEVVAIGPGEFPKKYIRDSKGEKTGFKYSKYFRPTELKPGQVVEIGGINIFDGDGYKFEEYSVNGETLLMCSEKDVAMVVDAS